MDFSLSVRGGYEVQCHLVVVGPLIQPPGSEFSSVSIDLDGQHSRV
jgi:hypothetical protein